MLYLQHLEQEAALKLWGARRWQDDSPDSWEFEDNLAPQLITDFEATEEGQRSLKLEEYQEGGYGQAGLPEEFQGEDLQFTGAQFLPFCPVLKVGGELKVVLLNVLHSGLVFPGGGEAEWGFWRSSRTIWQIPIAMSSTPTLNIGNGNSMKHINEKVWPQDGTIRQ